MNEMIERVGQALADECLRTFGTTWNNDVRWAFARAAMTAMREPTDAMADAGRRSLTYSVGEFTEDARDAWRDMIDAALKE